MDSGEAPRKKTSAWAKIRKHFSDLGFTNRLGLLLVGLIAAGLIMGFILANKAIDNSYTGALACFTIVFTPIGTACSIVLQKIVEKNMQENTSADGEGIVYAAAKAAGFNQNGSSGEDDNWESPRI